jgi:hypothetical protein
MNFHSLWAIGIGLFFGSMAARWGSGFGHIATTIGAIAMLIGIFGVVARKSNKDSNPATTPSGGGGSTLER